MVELDVHTHLAPINAEALQAIAGVQWNPADAKLVVDGHAVGIKSLFEPQRLLAWLDQNAIRRALVSIPPPLYRQELSPDAAATWVRYLNRELLAICAASQGRLGALLYLPLEHPGLVADLLRDPEVDRFEGIALAAGGHPSIEYSADHYLPLWEWANERSSFVFIHPGTCRDCRLANYYLENLVGNPHETAVAATHLGMRGIPARFPQIRFCLAHGGGTFPALVGRLQRGFDTRRPGVDTAVEHPVAAARRFYADGIAHHPSALQLAKDVFGADHVVFGSDWPFPMGLETAR